jgi:hypothetical protein
VKYSHPPSKKEWQAIADINWRFGEAAAKKGNHRQAEHFFAKARRALDIVSKMR